MQTVLKGSASKIRAVFTGADGEAVAPTSPKVTIIRDSDGVEIATNDAATHDGDGVVSYALTPAEIAEVDLLHASWSATGSYAAPCDIGVVGGFLCSIEEISSVITTTPAPSAKTIRGLREAAERRIEDACGVAFRPTYRRERLWGDGATGLLLAERRPSEILSAKIDGGDELSADVTIEAGQIVYEGGWPAGSQVDVSYIHGFTTPPDPISRATVALARYLVLEDPSNVFDRATSYTTEEATYSLVTPGVRGAETPIPEVNAVIDAYREATFA